MLHKLWTITHNLWLMVITSCHLLIADRSRALIHDFTKAALMLILLPYWIYRLLWSYRQECNSCGVINKSAALALLKLSTRAQLTNEALVKREKARETHAWLLGEFCILVCPNPSACVCVCVCVCVQMKCVVAYCSMWNRNSGSDG